MMLSSFSVSFSGLILSPYNLDSTAPFSSPLTGPQKLNKFQDKIMKFHEEASNINIVLRKSSSQREDIGTETLHIGFRRGSEFDVEEEKEKENDRECVL